MKKTPQTSREAFAQDASALWPLAKGSLTLVRRPCIRANCPACRSGEKHAAWIFTFRQGGRQRCCYVSKEFAPLVREAIANGRRLEARLTQAGVDLIESHRQRSGKAGRKGQPP